MKKIVTFSILALLAIQLNLIVPTFAQSIDPAFTNNYQIVTLGSIENLPVPYGGMAFMPINSNVLLIGGGSESEAGEIHKVDLQRDASNHIIGFKGGSTFYAKAPKIDSGLVVAPGNVLLFTRYPDNEIGQIMPDSAVTNKIEFLNSWTGQGSVGALGFVPKGFPGAGELRATKYNSSQMYVIGIEPDGIGTYTVVSASEPMALTGVAGAEGFVYATPGSPLFQDYRSLLVADWSGSSIHVFTLDGRGAPQITSRRIFATGISGAFGMVMDPETGDVLVSTWGGGNVLYAIRGFAAPPIANVGITQIAMPNPAYVGYNLKLLLTLSNNGPGIAYDTMLTNQLPNNVEFISATLSQGSFQFHSGQVVCSFSNLPPKTAISIELLVKPLAEGLLTNSAWVSSLSTDSTSSDDNTFMLIASRKMIAPTITVQPESQAVALGDTAGFNLAVGGTPPIYFQWRFNGSDISGATNAALILQNITTNHVGIYQASAWNLAGSVTSAPVTLDIQVPIAPPVITKQPTNLTVVAGEQAVFTVTATSVAPLAYQWFFNDNELPGATLQSLILNHVTTDQAGRYRVKVLNSAGSVTSDEATLAVNVPPSPPSFVVQPRSVTANVGESVLFSAVVSGTPPFAYQWQKNGTNLLGQIGSAFIIASATLNDAGAYRVIVTNNLGAVTSQAAILTINTAAIPPQIAQLSQDITAKPGTEAVLAVIATGTEPLQYQWENASGIVVGATNTSLKIIVMENILEYRVKVTNNGGSTLSPWVKVTPDFSGYGPVITRQPQDQTAAPGSSASFSVEVTSQGGQLKYQWLFNGTNLPSATNATLVLSNLSPDLAGKYRVVISNAYGTVSSVDATLSIAGLPASLAIDTYAGIAISGTVGSSYRIEYSLDLKQTNAWTILTNIVLPASPYLWIDVGSTNAPKRYYRAILAP